MSQKEDADSGPPQAGDVRREAQRRLRDKNAAPANGMAELDVRATLHELQVHQIELEMQNEELRRAQAALQEVSCKYQDLFDFAPVGYYLLDEQGRILEVNLAGAALLGLDRSTAVKQRFGQYVAPRSQARFDKFCRDVLRADGKRTCEIELHRGGGPVHALLEGIPVRAGGAEGSLRVTVTDISERKRAEQEMARLASFPMLNPQPVVEVDMEGRVSFANPAAQRLFPDLERLGPAHPWLSNWESWAIACREHGARIDARDVAVGDRHYHQAIHYVPAVRRVHVYGVDITKRMRADQELTRVKDSLQQTLNSITDCYYMLDPQWRFTRINDQALHYFEMPRGDFLGRCYWEVFPVVVGTVFEEYYKTAVAQRNPVCFDEFSPVTARWAEVRAYPSEEGLSVYFRDVSDRKRAEALLRELNTTLEQRVAQRTAELAQQAEQLRALALELTQAEQRERRRLAQVLHDHLQQLLVAARMKIGRLRRRVRENDLLQTIAEIDQMLNEAIDESRSLAVELCPPILYTCGLAAGLEWLGGQIREKFDLAVEVQADAAAEPAGETARAFLFQATGELLLNAAKHARAHRVQVRMTRVAVQHVSIEVCDDGVGFDPAQLAAKPGQGGFGMFSIRQRLEVFGGHLEIQSSPGQGTQVTIRAPLGKAAEEAAMNETEGTDSGPLQASDLRRKAEQRLLAREAGFAEAASMADARALVHELQVHQIELEMQNEELLRAQLSAVEASERYYDLFDFAPVGYFLWDHEGRILEVNLAGAALLGLTRSAIIHRRFGQFVAMEDRAAFAEFCNQALASNAKQTCEVQILKDGQPVCALLEGIAAQDRREPERLCRAAVIDITQQKRADELAAANQALEAEIAERKRVEEALVHAKLAAEAANVAKSQFLANMSHELRTPMNAIVGMTDLALQEELSPTLRDYLQTARQSADVLLELVNEILDLSRIEAGSVHLETTPFDLRETVEQVVKTLGVRAYEKGLELVCDLDDVPTRLVGDPLRLRQVLMNLVGNAVKFTTQGAVIVSVAAALPSPFGREAGGEGTPITLQFAVADTGVGIAPEDYERIFSPFTQADASTTRQYGGTGLGLTIARRLVDLMGGRIWVESEPGKGTIFRFTARFGRQEGQEESPGLPDAVREALGDLPVLIVAGNPAGGRILVETFQRWSMKPETAVDVPTALAKVRRAAGNNRSFRLIVADAVMSSLDGFALAESPPGEAPFAAPVIVMVAAGQRHACAQRCEELGVLVLEKPVSQAALFGVVAEALGIQASAVKTAGAAPPAILPAASRSLRVLLAEDTPANQKLVTYILGRRGHSVDVAENGRQAWEAVGREDFDAVLMDVQMPEMDGFQATREIRQLSDPKKARLPIIAMTAHALKGDAERCLAAGMDGYVSKPIKGEELIEMLERLVEQAAAAPLATAAAPLATAAAPSAQAAGQSAPAATPAGSVERPAEAQPVDEAAGAAAPASVFGLDDAVRRCFGKYAIFQEMVRCLFDEADPLLQQMRTALAGGNAAELGNAAHRLKGTVGYLVAGPAMDAVRRVEQMGRCGELAGAAESIRQLEEQVAILKQAVSPYAG